NVQGRPNRGQGMNPQGGSAAGYGRAKNRVGNVNQGQARPGQARTVKCYNCNGTRHIARNCTQPKRPQNSEYYKDKMLLMQAQENGVTLDAEQLLFLAGGQDNAFDDDVDEQPVQDLALNVDNVFQADNCDALYYDVDEAPTAQTIFIGNLSFADPVTDEAGPSYDSDILSEVLDHELYQDAACAHHEGYVTYDSVQLDHVVDSHVDYTIDSNMIPYDQYVKDNEVPVVHSDASSVLTDAFMMIYNDMCESHDQSISNPSWNTVEDKLIKQDQSLQTVHMLCRPMPHYNELNKVAIGYKNPLCLTRAKQIQPALYNGHEIIKDNHTPAIVHNAEDTLEIAEITRKKMNAKKFDKTCKKRITPTGLTKGEMGFEQTKECYLKEVIPFFKTLKDNFKGIQKALTKEIKEMKDIFEELEAEVAQYVVDRKHDAIERNNLLIANDNLIAACLSQDVFSVATNSELNVARFTEMHIANTTVEARCLVLEAELANLRDTNNHANQKELINHFSKLEVNHLNLQLKYQNLKDSIGNNPPTPDKDTPDFDLVFVIGKMQASLQGKDNVIRQLKKKLSQLQVIPSDTDRTPKHYKELKDTVIPQVLVRAQHAISVEPIVLRLRNNRDAHLDYLKHLKESVETIRDIVEEAKLAHTLLIRKNQVTIAKPSDRQDGNKHIHVVVVKPQKTNVPVPPSTGVKSCPKTSGSQPKSNPKPNRISPAKGVNKLPVEDQPRTNKSHLRTTNRVDSGRTDRPLVFGLRLLKTYDGGSLTACEFCKKVIGIVRFRNDHFGAIMGYEDYVVGNSVISRVYYVEGLGNNLFSDGQFYDSGLKVAF
nr:integrase, catalytic region, zinc finger, CCHC-type, peptidase aspartic, catalytic [Tanacetum cinerariifolium]